MRERRAYAVHVDLTDAVGEATVVINHHLGTEPTTARQRAGYLVRAVRSVLALHQPQRDKGRVECFECSTVWPCPTVRRVAAAFEVEVAADV